MVGGANRWTFAVAIIKKYCNMKKTMICALMAITVLSSTSCTKEKKTTPPTTPTTSGYPATMSAANYGFDGTGGTSFSSAAAGIVQTSVSFSITGIKDGTNESINIILVGVTDTGTYSLDKDNTAGHGAIISKDYTKPSDLALNYNTTGTEAGTGNIGGGKVKITTLTATDAEGTFYIIGYNNAGKAAFAEQGTFKGKINKQ